METYKQFSKEMGKDKTGLGRWLWLRIKRNGGFAYSSCKSKKMSLLQIYAQYMRYWKLQGIEVCAKDKILTGLLALIEIM